MSLRQFADGLAPSANDNQKAGRVIDKVSNILHQHLSRQYSIDRIRPLGSYAKKTSLAFNMDVDIVVYFNNERPPFPGIIDALENLVIRYLDKNCQKTAHGIKFTVDGVDVDLLPASNFSANQDFHLRNGKNRAEIQSINALEYLTLNPRSRSDISTSLSENAIGFERRHSAYSHALSRLAKFWSTTIGIPKFHVGRSSIMEYLGAKAAELEEDGGSHNLYSGFLRFLNMICQSDDLNIYWTYYYRDNVIPSSIKRQRPLLLDPTNPCNNLLSGSNGQYLKQMRTYANETLSRLRVSERRGISSIDMIFEPLPKLQSVYSRKTKSPFNYLIETIDSSQIQTKIITRAGAKGVKPAIARDYFFAFIDAIATSERERGRHRADISGIVQEKVQQFISPGNWYSTNESHKSRHMTFQIPIGQNTNEMILISLDWE